MRETTKNDLVVRDGLSVVTLDGFEDKDAELTRAIDPPGSANFFCETYGMAGDPSTDADAEGVLWTDYDETVEWRFSVLIDSDEVEALKAFAAEAGYEIDRVESVTEPMNFGDGNGTVEIVKHRDGWLVLGG